MTKLLNMVLQGKGGVGKSFVASLLAQHYRSRDLVPVCIDTDPINATFASYKAFDVHRIDLMNGDDLDPRAFDELIELVASADDDSVFVVDNGSATFVPLCSWMLENEVVPYFRESGIDLRLHTVITGGQGHGDTVLGLANVLRHFDVPVVIWLNEYFGKPERGDTRFENSAIVEENLDSIHALLRIAARRKETFGYDLERLLGEKKTFAEAADDTGLSIMARQRLAQIWRDLDSQITAANL